MQVIDDVTLETVCGGAGQDKSLKALGAAFKDMSDSKIARKLLAVLGDRVTPISGYMMSQLARQSSAEAIRTGGTVRDRNLARRFGG
jgi:hypothetical protein